jgi:transcriptional regulator with XRE-family HTH domain
MKKESSESLHMANRLKIKDLIRERNLTIRGVATEIGISEQGLQKQIRENSTKIETLEAIARVLKVPISEFFETSYQPGKNNFSEYSFANEITEVGAKAISDQLVRMMNDKLIAPYSLVEEKEKEIRNLNREIGKLEKTLEEKEKYIKLLSENKSEDNHSTK